MIPQWKFVREIQRLGQQLRGIPERLTDPLAQRRLDRAVAAGLPCFDGAVPVGAKVALYLVFQPAGISESTIHTCRWLAGHGYAPLIVSNAAVSASDREKLKPVIWRGVERPNFGYDFGGYRDGLASLARWNVAPETLLILNDSIWLPVIPESDILRRLEDDPADIAGTILRERGDERFLESYLYRIGAPALRHPAFAGYWASLQLTSNKYHVIRRGERGFSAAMRKAGLTVAGIYDAASLPERAIEQDDAFLEATLRHAAYIDAHLAQERDRLLTDRGSAWRDRVLKHMKETLRKRQAYSSYPFAMVSLYGYPVLKKSTEPVSAAWRRAYLAAVTEGALPAPPAAILKEIGLQGRNP